MRGRALVLCVLVGTALTSTSVPAGELIRYRRADGSVGFAGSGASLPPGAEVLSRKASPSDASRGSETYPDPLDIESALTGVRRHCESRFAPRGAAFDTCLADSTRAVFAVRDLLADAPMGSVAERLNTACQRRWARGRFPDYPAFAKCAEDAHAEFERETGNAPASLADADDSDRDIRSRRDMRRDRLRGLRDDQARAAREFEQGRATWGPRYRKAEQELAQAERKSRQILERMKRRGCRSDSLACGGLPEQLDAAQRDEQKKRAYLRDGIVTECRLAGCQPGWLR